jgi:hypothetical protein
MSGFFNWENVDASGSSSALFPDRSKIPTGFYEIQKYDNTLPNQFPCRIFFIVTDITPTTSSTEINDIRSSFRKFCTSRIFGGKKM